jgi:hypothetical protein
LGAVPRVFFLCKGKRRKKVKGMESKASEFIRFQINRKIVNLYKNFLMTLEDLRDPRYQIPEEVHKRLRKKTLDYGNDALREIEEYLVKVRIELE